MLVRKLSLIVLLLFLLMGCSSLLVNRESLGEKLVTKMNERYPEENFYLIYGLEREGSIATNIRYRGVLYSDRLNELNYPEGLEISLESGRIGEALIESLGRYYETLFWTVEFEEMGEKRTKEIFGDKSNFRINWTMTEPKYYGLKKLLDEPYVTREDKYGSWNTIVNVFVDDLEKIDIEEYKKKTFELSKYIYEEMNYVTSLQIYVRDDSYFENYELVKASVYRCFRGRGEVKEVLGKVNRDEELSSEEEVLLVKSFRKGGVISGEYRIITISSKGIKTIKELKNEHLGVSVVLNKKGVGEE